tara:strand:+ start:215 stop:859 length:645 start_codon:yes stop_codon:yes gene_type:complete
MKKFKVTFLFDKNNNSIEKFFFKYKNKKNKKYKFTISRNFKNVKNQDIVFILNYTKILPNSFLNKNKLNLVVHASDLPKDRGFAPLSYQILRGKNKIKISLFEAVKKLDSGNIYIKNNLKLNGTELSNELRIKQSLAVRKITENFLSRYPKLKSKKQIGKGNLNKRRTQIDSKIDINKSIKSQFNLLRICDNDLYPCFFYHKNTKYLLKIFKGK